ncbi:hypothetical protein MG293_005431 [Ovis ammon polii]|uniref:Uncharacterized protein n=1 Tax=Ovis ammon polii TaxID=230172 RepID=A0AAD4UK55_OVIAM|nr:hypothetical protein MG293_005431 [Ovis ammon polii]
MMVGKSNTENAGKQGTTPIVPSGKTNEWTREFMKFAWGKSNIMRDLLMKGKGTGFECNLKPALFMKGEQDEACTPKSQQFYRIHQLHAEDVASRSDPVTSAGPNGPRHEEKGHQNREPGKSGTAFLMGYPVNAISTQPSSAPYTLPLMKLIQDEEECETTMAVTEEYQSQAERVCRASEDSVLIPQVMEAGELAALICGKTHSTTMMITKEAWEELVTYCPAAKQSEVIVQHSHMRPWEP